MSLSHDQKQILETVFEFAETARKNYDHTKQVWTVESGTCTTIRVPVALLNRIRDMAELFELSKKQPAK